MKNKIYKFNKMRNAISFQKHAVKPLWIILGDDEKYWVVIPALANALNKAGYEYAI